MIILGHSTTAAIPLEIVPHCNANPFGLFALSRWSHRILQRTRTGQSYEHGQNLSRLCAKYVTHEPDVVTTRFSLSPCEVTDSLNDQFEQMLLQKIFAHRFKHHTGLNSNSH